MTATLQRDVQLTACYEDNLTGHRSMSRHSFYTCSTSNGQLVFSLLLGFRKNKNYRPYFCTLVDSAKLRVQVGGVAVRKALRAAGPNLGLRPASSRSR